MRALNAGCGGSRIPPWFGKLDEVRLDVDPATSPDFVAPITDMGDVGTFGLVYSSHVLEHLPAHEVDSALREILRVLEPGGAAIIFVPDLVGILPTDDVVYVSDAGPITGKDMIYGHGASIAQRPYMAHRTGFIAETLRFAMVCAGFKRVHVDSYKSHNLMGVGFK